MVSWFAAQIEPAIGAVTWSTSRVDVFVDLTGWWLSRDDRGRFVCRSQMRTTFEDGPELSGFTFGKRGSAIYGRIYDKTREIDQKGTTWWRDKWGSGWDGSRVLRVELQFARGVYVLPP